MRATLLLSLAIAFCAAYVHAQERAGSAHALAGLTFPYQPGPSGETEVQTYATAPGGTTLGWTASAGLFIRSALSVEGEAASTGVMRAREPSRYGQTFVEERRDRFYGANVRLHVLRGSRIDVEPVVGLFVAQHQGWRQTESSPLAPGQQPAIGPRIALTLPSTAGLQAGVDVRIGGRHLAVLPSLRLRYSGAGADAVDDDYAGNGWVSSTYPGGGFSRWTVSPAVLGRVDF